MTAQAPTPALRAEEPGAPSLARDVGRRNFAVVWLANFVTAVGMMGFIPLLPLYLRELGVAGEASERLWSGVMAAGAPLMAAFMSPLWGSLGDRLGRKAMLLRANLAIFLFVGAMGLASSVWMLLALRLLQGMFSGFLAPAMTLVSVSTPVERQARTLAWLQTGVLCGSAVGPLVGGQVGEVLGLRAVFLVCAAASLLAAGLVAWLVVEPEGPRVTGAAPSGRLLAGVLRDLRVLLHSRALRGLLLAVFAVRFGEALAEPVLTLFVETLEGVDAASLAGDAGLVFSIHALATVLATPLWGRLGDQRGARLVFALCAGGAGLCCLAQAWAGSLSPLLVLRFGSGVFLAGIMPAAYAAAARLSSAEQRGGAYGFTFSSVILARGLGLLAGGGLAASVGLAELFILGGALMALAAVGASRAGAGRPVPA